MELGGGPGTRRRVQIDAAHGRCPDRAGQSDDIVGIVGCVSGVQAGQDARHESLFLGGLAGQMRGHDKFGDIPGSKLRYALACAGRNDVIDVTGGVEILRCSVGACLQARPELSVDETRVLAVARQKGKFDKEQRVVACKRVTTVSVGPAGDAVADLALAVESGCSQQRRVLGQRVDAEQALGRCTLGVGEYAAVTWRPGERAGAGAAADLLAYQPRTCS